MDGEDDGQEHYLIPVSKDVDPEAVDMPAQMELTDDTVLMVHPAVDLEQFTY
jgi:hypothetical protein